MIPIAFFLKQCELSDLLSNLKNFSGMNFQKLIKPSLASDDEEADNMELKPTNNNEDNNEDSSEETGHMMPAVNKTGVKYRFCDFCEITVSVARLNLLL